ncbi:hypothetical protein PVK06_044482 [Gossypium arboreum]|uniref:RNase H type-1 domain-containing protein n=1 Tax=Gossypium arboreum TaxID=29729 RepID=A0ABR0MT99_GOSAR|nr:hypothetical protein PVK06_044482 [Gossypium arboreum]
MVSWKKKLAFQNLKDHLKEKINSWSLRHISQGGKEVFIKFVLQAIPTYTMACFLLPKSLCLELENIVGSFWWRKNHGKREQDADRILCIPLSLYEHKDFFIWRAKVVAGLQALQLEFHLGLREVEIEGDSRPMIRKLQEKLEDRSEIVTFINDSKNLRLGFQLEQEGFKASLLLFCWLVMVRVVRIFTDMSISPSLSPRQCPNHYAFRASRNLPDKKFPYLRTVIVTAAVHWGFGHRLPCHQVTNFLDLPALGRRQPPYMVLRLCGDLCFWITLRGCGFFSTNLSPPFTTPMGMVYRVHNYSYYYRTLT